jgi:class 3 adenylate cyclase
MKPPPLTRLLDKQKASELLRVFLDLTPQVSSCWIVDTRGQCLVGYPQQTQEDFAPLLRQPLAVGQSVWTAPYIGAPIYVEDERLGLVVVQSQHDGLPAPLERAVQSLSAVFTQFVALGLEKRQIALDALDKYREITLLYTIGETISACLDVDQIAHLVLDTTGRFIKAEHSSVMLLHPATGQLDIRAASGVEYAVKPALREGGGIAGLVVQTGTAEIVNEPQADPRVVAPSNHMRSLLCVPLKVQDRSLGVVNLSNKLAGEMFTAADAKLLQTLASQAAIAIENARLVAQLQEKNQALEAALRKVELLEKAKSHLSKFVPQSVQRLIDDNPEAPALDRQDREVSVLFLDIAGYTRLSAALDQAKVNYLIERYFSSFLDAIYRNHGDINETAGDGLMILFQDPRPATHAVQAARTALAICNQTHQINAALHQMDTPVLVNIGINSGLASVGSAKFEGITGTRWTYTASGMVTNLAARLAAFATGGAILVSAATARQITERFCLADLGHQQFKNVSEPLRVFRLLAEKGVRHGEENLDRR